MDNPALYIGLMSGTSLDAIDAVLIDFTNSPRIAGTLELAMPANIREEIRSLNTPCTNDLARSLVLDKKLAGLFSQAVLQLLAQASTPARMVAAIGSHGQTLRHAPDGDNGYSLQAGDPNLIAERTGITVVADFRMRDIAAGGQGAPLVPAFHQAVFSCPGENRVIINIGGMANISLLYADGRTGGFDTGPGNVLMDHWCEKNRGDPFDRDGEWAKSGVLNTHLLAQMLEEPFFRKPPPKSTGRDRFDAHWLEQFNLPGIPPEDVQATLLELTAQSICDAIPDEMNKLYLCGGGANNRQLASRVAAISGKPVESTQALGIPAKWVEAAAFAWLAKQAMNNQPGNLPEVTGARGKRVLGGIYQK